MKRRWLAGGVLVVFLAVGTVEGGAGEVAALQRILLVLGQMNQLAGHVNGLVEDIRDKFEMVFPYASTLRIRRYFRQVRDVQYELERLSCGWRFSRRTRRLWNGLYRGLALCKPDIELLLGTPLATFDADLVEYSNWSATRRLNTIGTQHEEATQDAHFARWLATEAQKGRRPEQPGQASPGYSQRLTAAGTAFLGKLAAEEGQLLRDDLEREELRFAELRRRKLLQQRLALSVYMGLASLDGSVPGGAAAALNQNIQWWRQ